MLYQNIDTSSIFSVLATCDKNWSSLAQDVILSSIINVIWVVWYCRNKLRFDNKLISFHAATNLVRANVSLFGFISSGVASSSMQEFTFLIFFSVDVKPPKAPRIKEVCWFPSSRFWIKCNTDGAARGCPGPAASGGLFRGSDAAFLGGFSSYVGIANAFCAELTAVMIAIESAFQRGWHRLWIECDSMLVLQAFSDHSLVPWKIRNRWKNCVHLSKCMFFQLSHIFREGNSCADKLANHGLSSLCYTWWDQPPSFISADFIHNRIGLPNFRFK